VRGRNLPHCFALTWYNHKRSNDIVNKDSMWWQQEQKIIRGECRGAGREQGIACICNTHTNDSWSEICYKSARGYHAAGIGERGCVGSRVLAGWQGQRRDRAYSCRVQPLLTKITDQRPSLEILPTTHPHVNIDIWESVASMFCSLNTEYFYFCEEDTEM
jgi:hypothetical protein